MPISPGHNWISRKRRRDGTAFPFELACVGIIIRNGSPLGAFAGCPEGTGPIGGGALSLLAIDENFA